MLIFLTMQFIQLCNNSYCTVNMYKNKLFKTIFVLLFLLPLLDIVYGRGVQIIRRYCCAVFYYILYNVYTLRKCKRKLCAQKIYRTKNVLLILHCSIPPPLSLHSYIYEHNQGWEFAHRFSKRIACFLPKNEKMSDSLKKMSDSLIRSFLVSALSDSLTIAHFLWATWANRSWSLIFGEWPERFAHIAHIGSDMSDSLTSLNKKEGMSDSLIFLNKKPI